MSSIDRLLIKNYTTNVLFKIILSYLLFGSILVLGNNSELSYIDMISFANGNTILISFFYIPSVILLGYYIFDDIKKNKSLITRFENKKVYFYFQFRILFKVTTILFLWQIFIVIICANLFADRSHFIVPDKSYNEISNFVGMIVNVIKLYLFSLIFQVFNIFLKNEFSKHLSLIFTFLVLYSLFNYYPFQALKYIGFILPSRYIGFSYIYNTFIENIIYSFLYLSILLLIGFLISKRTIVEKDIEVKN